MHLMRNLDYADLRDLDRQLQRNKICSDNAQKTRYRYCIQLETEMHTTEVFGTDTGFSSY